MVDTRGSSASATTGTGGAPGGGEDGAQPDGPGGPAPPVMAPTAAFALTPALLSNEVLDFNDVGAIKLYYKASDSLDIEFDVEPGTLKLFLESIRQRAVAVNWMSTLTIQKGINTFNLVDDYGSLTFEEVRTRVMLYNGLNVRDAQNSIQIFHCASTSLTEAGKTRVFLEAHKYTINGIADGLLFLKVVIQLAHVDTRATITVIRTRLSSLDARMINMQDDVTLFNEFVKTQRVSLEARGERTLDLLVNLFKGYKAAADDRFVKYIEGKEDDYNEGKDMSPDALMELAEAKYKTLLESELWKQPTAADRKIVALTAQLQKLGNPDTDKDTPKTGYTGKKKFPDGDKDPKWFLTPPKAGEQPKKQKGGKDWWWCPNHAEKGKWVRHEPTACEQPKREDKVPPTADKKEQEKKEQDAETRLKIKTLAALLDSEGDDF